MREGDGVFASLPQQLDEGTYGTLMRRSVGPEARDRFVAVIDCRGEKSLRRSFSRWHEIAHALTLGPQVQLEFPFHRSTDKKPPKERLMDQIAAIVGFWSPLFRPLLLEELCGNGRLCFEVVERVRQRFTDKASFQATLIACVREAPLPVIYLEAKYGLKKHEQRFVESGQGVLFGGVLPEPKLRVPIVIANAEARKAELEMHQNMEVPAGPLIASLFNPEGAAEDNEVKGMENLSLWMHSDGTTLADRNVCLEARLFKGEAFGLVTLAE